MIASLYTGLSVPFLVVVFRFFSLRPSQISDTFTYGSEEANSPVKVQTLNSVYACFSLSFVFSFEIKK